MKNIFVISFIFVATNSAMALPQTKSSANFSRKAKTRTRAESMPAKPATSAINSTNNLGNTSVAESTGFSPTIHAGYTGIISGPILDAEKNSSSNISVSNRLTARADFTENLNAGIQARVSTAFLPTGVTAANENWRVFADIRKIYADDVIDFNLTPRIMLPTSNAAHNQTLVAGPEVIATLNIIPRNSRFSFDYKAQTQKNFYTDKLASSKSVDFYLLHNLEAAYTLNSAVEINMGLYPEYMSTKNASFTNTSNELDLGLSWSFAKGWALNPYLATELNGLDSSNLGKSMQANLILSGSFL